VENGTTAPSANLTFSYRGTENTIAGISCPGDVLVSQYWNGASWIGVPALNPGSSCVTSGSGSVQANSVSVFTTASSQPFILVKNSNPLSVESFSSPGGLHVTAGQSPSTGDGDVWISITGAENKNIIISITDMLGQRLYTKNLTDISGSYILNTGLQLAGGMYVVNASAGNEFLSDKIIVVK